MWDSPVERDDGAMTIFSGLEPLQPLDLRPRSEEFDRNRGLLSVQVLVLTCLKRYRFGANRTAHGRSPDAFFQVFLARFAGFWAAAVCFCT